MKKTAIFLLLALCFAFRLTAQINEVTVQYIKQYYPIAVQNMQQYRIPASITLAQGILESSSGKSSLAVQANNHFGIKCHKEWTGQTFIQDDDTVGECFRVYENALESYNDHSLFLTTRSRYANLFTLDICDYTAWAKGLKAAGYATNPKYPELLIKLIENYGLAQYDRYTEPDSKIDNNLAKVIPPNTKEELTKLSPKNTHTPARKDTASLLVYKPIETKQDRKRNRRNNTLKQTDTKGEFIIQFDDISSDKIIYTYDVEEPKENQTPSCTVAQNTANKGIIKPAKQTQAVVSAGVDTAKNNLSCGSVCNGVKFIIVAKGETFYGLSKKNNITINEILEYNDLPSNYVLQIGDRLYTQKKKDKNLSQLYHEVKEGESLLYISQLYAVRKEALMRLNNCKDDAVSVGQKIMLQ